MVKWMWGSFSILFFFWFRKHSLHAHIFQNLQIDDGGKIIVAQHRLHCVDIVVQCAWIQKEEIVQQTSENTLTDLIKVEVSEKNSSDEKFEEYKQKWIVEPSIWTHILLLN